MQNYGVFPKYASGDVKKCFSEWQIGVLPMLSPPRAPNFPAIGKKNRGTFCFSRENA